VELLHSFVLQFNYVSTMFTTFPAHESDQGCSSPSQPNSKEVILQRFREFLVEHEFWEIWRDQTSSLTSTESFDFLSISKIRTIRFEFNKQFLFFERTRLKMEGAAKSEFASDQTRLQERLAKIKACHEMLLQQKVKEITNILLKIKLISTTPASQSEQYHSELRRIEEYHNTAITSNPKFLMSTHLWTLNPTLNSHAPVIRVPLTKIEKDKQKEGKRKRREERVQRRRRVEEEEEKEGRTRRRGRQKSTEVTSSGDEETECLASSDNSGEERENKRPRREQRKTTNTQPRRRRNSPQQSEQQNGTEQAKNPTPTRSVATMRAKETNNLPQYPKPPSDQVEQFIKFRQGDITIERPFEPPHCPHHHLQDQPAKEVPSSTPPQSNLERDQPTTRTIEEEDPFIIQIDSLCSTDFFVGHLDSPFDDSLFPSFPWDHMNHEEAIAIQSHSPPEPISLPLSSSGNQRNDIVSDDIVSETDEISSEIPADTPFLSF